MTRATKILSAALCVFIVSCKQGLDHSAYIKYIQDKERGLKKEVTVGEWEYIMQYRPYDYIILQEGKGHMNPANIEKRKMALRGTAWFNISFRLSDGQVSPMRYNLTSREDYDDRLKYFLNSASRNIILVYGPHDTLLPIAYLFENNYNLAPQETMVVGFDLPEKADLPEKDMLLCYHDELFKNGIIKVTYKSDDIKSIPNLIY